MKKDKNKYEKLKKRFVTRHKQALKTLTDKHKLDTKALGTIGAGALASALLLAPVAKLPLLEEEKSLPVNAHLPVKKVTPIKSKTSLSIMLMKVLPSKVQALTEKQAQEIKRILRQAIGMQVNVELEEKRLNTVYGYIGAEQHLPRFPEDDAIFHGDTISPSMTEHLGAWGYFVQSRDQLTPEMELQEKYYFAVQTFMAPDWRENVYQLKEWFKYRKMIAVNPKTGEAVVGVVADAGPAAWTGKQFGGSPETMQALGLSQGKRSGEILLLFVDDPENKVLLGPVGKK